MQSEMQTVAIDTASRFNSRTARPRWAFMIGIALAASLGLAGCAGADDKADGKDKSSESSTKDDSSDWKSISEKALVSTDMEMLSEHKAELDEPSHPAKVELPFQFCEVDKGLYESVRDSAFQMFDGDPAISARGFAIDGSAQEQFAALSDAWTSNTCDSYVSVYDTEGAKYEFKDAKPIGAPKDLGEDGWFGACYEGTSDSGDTIGECRVVFVVGDDGIAELISQQPVDENELNSAFLALVAAEALAG